MQTILLFIFMVQSTGNQSADSLYILGDSLYYAQNYELAIDLYRKAAVTYTTGSGLKISNTYNDIGLCYYHLGQADSALANYQRALQLDIQRSDTLKIIRRKRNIAIINGEQGDFLKATTLLLEARVMADRVKDLSSLAAINTLLGNMNMNQGNNHQALEYFRASEYLHIETDNQNGLAVDLNNIGNVYLAQNLPDTALHFLSRAKTIKKSQGSISSLAYTLQNLGEAYLRLKQYDSAEIYLKQAFDIRDSLNERRGQAYSANELARLYLQLSKNQMALRHLKITRDYAISFQNRNMQMANLEVWAAYYKHTGQLKMAINTLENWTTLRDSIYNEEKLKVQELISAQQLDQLEKEKILAERESRQAQMEKLEEQQKAAKTLITAAVLGCFLLIAIVLVLVIQKQRRRVHVLNETLNEQNKKIALLNDQNLHFTRNALSEISGLLGFQSKKLEGVAHDMIMDARLRLETTNILYNQLFSNKNHGASELVLSDLLEKIVHNTLDAILPKENRIERNLDIDTIKVTSELGLSLSLVVNEICINACKYAFKHDQVGILDIVLKSEGDRLTLLIRDTGPGLPENIDWRNATSFGMQLIRLLTADIDAEIEVSSTPSGVCYKFNIPLNTN